MRYRTAGAWGAGLGRNLTPAEVDENFYETVVELAELAGTITAANPITNIVQSGSQFSVFMQDGSEYGPFTLPVATWRDRGTWAAATDYYENDIVSVAGLGVYRVLEDHTSDTTFDADAANSNGDLYSLLISAPNPAQISTISAATLTPDITYANKYMRCTNASGCVVNIVSGIFPLGTELHFRQVSAGPISFMAGDSAVFFNAPFGAEEATNLVGATVTLKLVTESPEEWDLIGQFAEASA
jgi:hypothetical protein